MGGRSRLSACGRPEVGGVEFGVGRFYIESTQIAVAQLCVGLFGTVFVLFCFIGFLILLGGMIWAIVDAIMMFTGGVEDDYGRKLR